MQLEERYEQQFFHMKNWDEDFLNDFFKKIKNLLPTENDLTPAQYTLIEDMQVALNKTYRALEPLIQANLINEFGIAGGAIRDLLLKKEPKDIDIVISLKNLHEDKNEKINTKHLSSEVLAWFEQKNCIKKTSLLIPNMYSFESIQEESYIMLNDFMTVIVEKMNSQGKLHLNCEDVTADYQNSHIMGILKTKEYASRPVDLIFTSRNVRDFTNTFSFDICKGFLIYHENLNTLSTNDWINHIIVSKQMVHDIEKKTLTINLSNINMQHLEYFLNKHYLKMKEKFPQYTLEHRCSLTTNGKDISEMEKKIMEVKIQEHYDDLQNKMSLKDDEKEAKGRMKI